MQEMTVLTSLNHPHVIAMHRVEDLVHETAMLARFSHKHIIKLHGRAGGFDADSSLRLNDGYFILVDRLKGENLLELIHI